MGRLGYKKSRNGCQKCKTRRVKCDEKVPCSACRKHGLSCSLQYATTSTTSPSGTSVESESQKRKPRHRRNAQRHKANLSIPVRSRSPSIQIPEYPPNLPPIVPDPWVEDIELMHHYTSHTHATFHKGPVAQLVFKNVVPQVSFRFPYLLHQILALTAFHLAHLRPEQRQAYRVRAAQHQTKSISGMRGALAGEFTEDNAYALFCTSVCLMGSAFASKAYGDDTGEETCPLDGFLEVTTLLKGMKAIQKQMLGMMDENTAKKRFGFKFVGSESESSTLQDCSAELESFKENILEALHIEQHIRETILEAADELLSAMNPTKSPEVPATTELSVVFTWLDKVSGNYLSLVRDRHPAALTILLFFCVMLQSTEESFWLLTGWGTSLATVISKLLTQSPWVEWKTWPLETIDGLQ